MLGGKTPAYGYYALLVGAFGGLHVNGQGASCANDTINKSTNATRVDAGSLVDVFLARLQQAVAKLRE